MKLVLDDVIAPAISAIKRLESRDVVHLLCWQVVKLLVTEGAGKDNLDERCSTPLITPADSGHLEVCHESG